MTARDWGRFVIHEGDCLDVMRSMPDCSVQCCITSPPYFGLRDYGHAGQIGTEATPDEFVAKLVEVFAEVRRVLRDDGTLWLNLGDTYAGNGGLSVQSGKEFESRMRGRQLITRSSRAAPSADLKAKDLVGIPWRVAFALRADGWYLRQDIIWHKPNPMPESVTDRCTKAHEYLFLLSKSERYYFDTAAMQEPAVDTRGPGNVKPVRDDGSEKVRTRGSLHTIGKRATRNRRSVWTVTTKPFKGAHFATYPPDLIEPCVLAGSRPGDVVLDPFGGAGTTAMVAARNGRIGVMAELNPEYASLAERRIADALFPGAFGAAA